MIHGKFKMKYDTSPLPAAEPCQVEDFARGGRSGPTKHDMVPCLDLTAPNLA